MLWFLTKVLVEKDKNRLYRGAVYQPSELFLPSLSSWESQMELKPGSPASPVAGQATLGSYGHPAEFLFPRPWKRERSLLRRGRADVANVPPTPPSWGLGQQDMSRFSLRTLETLPETSTQGRF